MTVNESSERSMSESSFIRLQVMYCKEWVNLESFQKAILFHSKLRYLDSCENLNLDSSVFARILEIIEEQPMLGRERGEFSSSEV